MVKNEEYKFIAFCPELVSKCDKGQTRFHLCIQDGCVAYAGGYCRKYHNNVIKTRKKVDDDE